MKIHRISFLSVFYPYRGGIALFSDLLNLTFKKKWETNAINFKRQYPNFLFPGKTQYVEENSLLTKSDNIRLVDSINPISFYKTARQINQSDSQLLITRYWMSFFAPALGTICRNVNKKVVKIALLDNVIPHEKRFFDDVFNKYYLKAQDGFVVMSQQVLDDLKMYLPNAKYVLLDHPKYNQFGTLKNRVEVAEELHISADKKTVLFFGLIRDYKGLDLLIEAFEFLNDSYQLVIAGECYGSFDKYELLIANNKNKDRIFVFNEFIPDDKIVNFFSIADVCVLPYRSATQSGIHAISDHFEVPTLVTNVGGLSEYIEDGDTGVLVQEVNAKAISEGIRRFFDLKDQVDFSQNIRQKQQVMDWDGFATEIINFAESLKK